MMHNKKVIHIILWILLVIYLLSFLFTTSSDFTQDLGRHLKLGEIITQTKTVPKTNLFSYTYSNFPFINHHWFSEVIFFISQKWLGLNSLIFLKACVIGLAIIIAAVASGSIWSIAVAFIISPLILERADIRPEIFGFLAFSLLLWELKKVQKTKRISVYLPIIFLFWINIHISFIFGLFLLGILFLIAEKSKKNILVCVFCFGVLFINPNGVRGVLEPLAIFNNYGYSIAENQTMFFLSSVMHDVFIRYYFLCLPFIFVALCILFLRKKYTEFFILITFSGLALYQVRHLPFFVIAAIAIIPTAIIELRIKIKYSVRLLLSLGMMYLFIAGIILFGSNIFFETFDINKTLGIGYENKREGNIFNNFDIGSYLSYQLFPAIKVFVDGRPEAYPASFFQNGYIPLETDQNKQDLFFNKYNIHTVVISHTDQTPWGNVFLSRILQNKQWKMIFVDPVFIVLSDSEKDIDIRNSSSFEKQIDNEDDFFHIVQYIHLFNALGDQTKIGVLLQKIDIIRPHSCTLVRMHQRESNAPWCSF